MSYATDAATLGLAWSEEGKANFAINRGIDPNSGYYAAGQVVGAVTTEAVIIIGTAGLGAGVSGAKGAAGGVRSIAGTGRTGSSTVRVAPKTSRYANYSDQQFLQEIATRAERYGVRKGWGPAGSGNVQGTLKHDYSKRLLQRYQQSTGQRQHLMPERSWVKGQVRPYGTRGSARPDVFDPRTGTIYDYKFERLPGRGIRRAQRERNEANVPDVKQQTAICPG